MTGRENKRENDLFFVCSVIEVMGRMTKNRRGFVVRTLGEKAIARLLDLADVYHCEPVETVAADFIKQCAVPAGDFDNVASCKYNVPTHFDIAKVYKRLIFTVAETQHLPLIAVFQQVYSSWISEKIDDYNSSMYFENPQYIHESYRAGETLKN